MKNSLLSLKKLVVSAFVLVVIVGTITSCTPPTGDEADFETVYNLIDPADDGTIEEEDTEDDGEG